MSTLNVSNISDGTDTVGTSYVVNGSAKAWDSVLIDATLEDSFNVSSITDTGTGEHTHTLTSAMSNSTFSIGASCEGFIRHISTAAASASTVSVDNFNNADIKADANHTVQVFGDLA